MPKQAGAKGTGKQVEYPNGHPTLLKDWGVSKKQSSQWQKLAAIPAPEFEKRLAGAQSKASYAKQADDKTLMNLCVRVKARAIRRCGELLREIAPSNGGRPSITRAGTHPSSRKDASEKAGLSPHKQKTAIRVASIATAEFESSVESANPPTVTELAKRGTTAQKPRFDIGDRNPADVQVATHGQGALNDFVYRTNGLPTDQVARGSVPHEYSRVLSQATKALAWIHDLQTSMEAEQQRRSV